MKTDVMVLGAGIVGVSTAVHLAMRGRETVLVDRAAPGHGTSFGNAGLIQREGIYPYGFPRQFRLLLRYALNRGAATHYHAGALPGLVPFLARYWWHSAPLRHRAIARAYAPLIERSIDEHAALIAQSDAGHLVRKTGWLMAFRTAQARDAACGEAEMLAREFGIGYDRLSSEALHEAEPFLQQGLLGGLRWTDPWSVSDPQGLVSAYAALFEKLGGTIVAGDARTLQPAASGKGWQVVAGGQTVEAREAVVALGPWSDEITRKLGYRLPLAVKRGYHMHYRAEGNAVLTTPVIDAEGDYLLTPMVNGIRLTTGIELARRDAPKTPVQLGRAEALARKFFPLGERVDDEPWMGARPVTPDMMPIIGKAPRHDGLWFGFGHAHHGLTLGPITGRILAEAIAGETPAVDLHPYRAERFGA